MALIKDAILSFKAQGVEQIATAGSAIASSFDHTEESVKHVAEESERAYHSMKEYDFVAKTANKTIAGLAGKLSKVATATALIGQTLGISDNPFLSGIGSIARGAGIGAAFGGVPGALIGAGIEGLGLLLKHQTAGPAVEVTNHISVEHQGPDIERMIDRANEEFRRELERQLRNRDENLSRQTRVDLGS